MCKSLSLFLMLSLMSAAALGADRKPGRCVLNLGIYPLTSFFIQGPNDMSKAQNSDPKDREKYTDDNLRLCKGSITDPTCKEVEDASVKMDKIEKWIDEDRNWVVGEKGPAPATFTEYVARFTISTDKTVLRLSLNYPPIQRLANVSSICMSLYQP